MAPDVPQYVSAQDMSWLFGGEQPQTPQQAASQLLCRAHRLEQCRRAGKEGREAAGSLPNTAIPIIRLKPGRAGELSHIGALTRIRNRPTLPTLPTSWKRSAKAIVLQKRTSCVNFVLAR
jgi:hypothetical protein